MDIGKNNLDLILVIISSIFIVYGLYGPIFNFASLVLGLILLIILAVLMATELKKSEEGKQ